MILFKFLFRASTHPSQTVSSSAGAAVNSAAKRMGAVAKQATVFAEASMLLVNRSALQNDEPRINAALFMAGAVGYLADRSGLGDTERFAVLCTVLEHTGLMTEGEAYTFASDMPEVSESSAEGQLRNKGRETVHSWLSGEDDAAPARLAKYVEEWAAA
jgi:hypothetical protein